MKNCTLGFLFLLHWESTFAACGVRVRCEAESATYEGLTLAVDRAGFSGSGYLEGFQDWDVTKRVVFQVQVDSTADYQVRVQFASPYGRKDCRMKVDGRDTVVAFSHTSIGWNARIVEKYRLSPGLHEVEIYGGGGYYFIDWIMVLPVPAVVVPLLPMVWDAHGRVAVRSWDLLGRR